MKAQPSSVRDWVCAYCGNDVPKGYAHKCLEYDRVADNRGASVAYLWPSANLKDIARQIEDKAIEDAANESVGVLGFRGSHSHIRNIEAAFNVALHLRRIAAASVDTHPKDGDVQQAPLVSGAVPKADAQ